MRFRPTLWPTVFTIPTLIVLLALGTWQVERLAWKQALIDRLQARSAGPAVDLPVGIDDVAGWEFRNVRLKGRYLHERELYLLGRSKSGEAGVHVLTPLVRDGKRGTVLVDRGWVPPERRDPATRSKGQIAGPVEVEGMVRIAKPQGFFTPDNEPGQNLWFFFDPVPMAAATAPHPPEGPFPIAIQRELCRRMAEAVGIDFEAARLDETLHPFSGGVPEDSRITTRYEEDDFAQGMMGVLHESGHAMYEIGRPADWRYQPVGQARGMVLHESQSLIVEMQVCRSPEFLGWAAPVIAEAFAIEGPTFEAENLYRLATRVERSLIRVDADEVTYPAHVILRYRLELAMIGDELDPADLPGAWNDGLEALLGIRPPDDRLGCLQDIHWYDGAWGYFPTYTLGAMAAAQLFQAARTADPEIVPGIAAGDFGPLMAWLRPNVHALGCRYSTAEVLERATGRPLDPGAFKAHLRERYLG